MFLLALEQTLRRRFISYSGGLLLQQHDAGQRCSVSNVYAGQPQIDVVAAATTSRMIMQGSCTLTTCKHCQGTDSRPFDQRDESCV